MLPLTDAAWWFVKHKINVTWNVTIIHKALSQPVNRIVDVEGDLCLTRTGNLSAIDVGHSQVCKIRSNFAPLQIRAEAIDANLAGLRGDLLPNLLD